MSAIPRAEAGFTLVELMVSLFIFSLIAAASVGLLRFSVDAQGSATRRLDDIGALQRTDALLSADLAQAAPRPARDEQGVPQPAFAGPEGGDGPLLRLVRRGWSNPDDQPRASLQKIEYRLTDDRLERLSWPRVDGAAPSPPTTLLTGVRAARLRFLGADGWRDRWNPRKADTLPRAVELTLELDRFGRVRQLFLTGPDA